LRDILGGVLGEVLGTPLAGALALSALVSRKKGKVLLLPAVSENLAE
jgi:hypothetical protein